MGSMGSKNDCEQKWKIFVLTDFRYYPTVPFEMITKKLQSVNKKWLYVYNEIVYKINKNRELNGRTRFSLGVYGYKNQKNER